MAAACSGAQPAGLGIRLTGTTPSAQVPSRCWPRDSIPAAQVVAPGEAASHRPRRDTRAGPPSPGWKPFTGAPIRAPYRRQSQPGEWQG
jgi:hypothetical protein